VSSLAVEGWQACSSQICSRGYSGVLDDIGLDPQGYTQEGSPHLLSFSMEREIGGSGGKRLLFLKALGAGGSKNISSLQNIWWLKAVGGFYKWTIFGPL